MKQHGKQRKKLWIGGLGERGDMMEESRLQQKLFIKRERVRRELIHTKEGETICLNHEQTELVLKWIKELETQVTELEERMKK